MDLLVQKEALASHPARHKLRAALVISICLLASTAILVSFGMPAWAYPLWNTGMAATLLVIALAIGLRPATLGLTMHRRGLLVATVGVAAVAAVYAIGLAIPATRAAFHDTRAAGLTLGGLLWAAMIRVPFGTVLLEELAFRGVLPALLGGLGKRWRWKPVLAASGLFGLWHLFPALNLAQRNDAVHALLGSTGAVLAPILVMLAAMGAGIVLSAWRHAGRGLLAPFLLHTTTNSGGYFLAWVLIT